MKRYYEDFKKTILIDFVGIPLEQINEIDFWIKRFTPSVRETAKCKSDYKIKIKKYNENCYNELFNHTIIKGNINGDEGAIGKYVSQVFQKLVIKQKIIYVHSSCVSKGNQGVIIIGDFGQGKTSIALECVLKDKEVKLVSDNGIAIQNNKIIGHVNSISLRNGNTTMLNKIGKNKKLICGNMTYFDYEPEHFEEINIKSIIIPYINAEDNNIYNVDDGKGKWYLYNKLALLLNGEALLLNGNIPSKNFSNKKNSKIIVSEVNNLIKNIPLRYVSCNFNGIVREILGDLDEKK